MSENEEIIQSASEDDTSIVQENGQGDNEAVQSKENTASPAKDNADTSQPVDEPEEEEDVKLKEGEGEDDQEEEDVKLKEGEGGGDGQEEDVKEEEGGEEEDDEEEEVKPGLLEQPVIVEGKRQRKKIERLSEKLSKDLETNTKPRQVVIPDGKGVTLGDVEYIQYQLGKTKVDDLKLLYRILFGHMYPQMHEVKGNIRKFNGFDFTRDSKEHEKKMDILTRVFMAPMKQMLDILGLEKTGIKGDLVNRLIDFLYEPKDLKRKVPQPIKKKSKGSKSKPKSKGDHKKKVAKTNTDDSSSNQSESEEKAPPKKKAKIEKKKAATPKKKKATPKKKEAAPKKKAATPKKKAATPKKKEATPKKKPAKKAKPEVEVSVSDDSSDSDSSNNAPLFKKPQPPTDDELREAIKKILDGADLEEITMKNVCKEVYDKYPKFDLLPRKTFIKATVKEIIN